MYAYILKTKAVPAIKKLYGDRAVWQDNLPPYTELFRAACRAFQTGITHYQQAPKMADI